MRRQERCALVSPSHGQCVKSNYHEDSHKFDPTVMFTVYVDEMRCPACARGDHSGHDVSNLPAWLPERSLPLRG